MLTSRDGFAQNQDALIRIRDHRILDGMKAFFSTECFILSGRLLGTLKRSFRGIDQNMINTFNELLSLGDHRSCVLVKHSDLFEFALR